MQCKSCGYENSRSDTRCQSCGKPLSPPAAPGGGATVKRCRHCGSEYQSGFCPACGRWAGSVPRGIFRIGLLRIIGSAFNLLVMCLVLLALADKIKHGSLSDRLLAFGVFAGLVFLLSVFQIFYSINLLRLKHWAYTIFRVLTIIGIGLAALSLIFFILFYPNPQYLLQAPIEIFINIVILSYLRGKDYMFSSKTAVSAPPIRMKCASCGNEDLTSFDVVCPKCGKARA